VRLSYINIDMTYASCCDPDPIPFNIIPAMIVGMFFAAKATIFYSTNIS
jgi:hypothetical protein